MKGSFFLKFKPGVGIFLHNIALPTARASSLIISALPVRSTSFSANRDCEMSGTARRLTCD